MTVIESPKPKNKIIEQGNWKRQTKMSSENDKVEINENKAVPTSFALFYFCLVFSGTSTVLDVLPISRLVEVKFFDKKVWIAEKFSLRFQDVRG